MSNPLLVHESTKEANEVDIRALRKSFDGELPIKYRDARMGMQLMLNVYRVVAMGDDGQKFLVAEFHFDDFDGGKRRDTARIMAQQLCDSINESK